MTDKEIIKVMIPDGTKGVISATTKGPAPLPRPTPPPPTREAQSPRPSQNIAKG